MKGTVFTTVSGSATYYLRQKIKANGGHWNPKHKVWYGIMHAVDSDFIRELEADAFKALPEIKKHKELKAVLAAKNDEKSSVIQSPELTSTNCCPFCNSADLLACPCGIFADALEALKDLKNCS
jgi:hypothetical protein